MNTSLPNCRGDYVMFTGTLYVMFARALLTQDFYLLLSIQNYKEAIWIWSIQHCNFPPAGYLRFYDFSLNHFVTGNKFLT